MCALKFEPKLFANVLDNIVILGLQKKSIGYPSVSYGHGYSRID